MSLPYESTRVYWVLHNEGTRHPRVTFPTRHAPFGFSSHGRGRLVHHIGRVAIYWHGTRAILGARFLCGSTTRHLRLTDTTDVAGRDECEPCALKAAGDAARVVYFASKGDRIKIGCSLNVRSRCQHLGARLLATEPGGYTRERELHREFARYALTGEWFERGPRLLRYIDDLLKLAS